MLLEVAEIDYKSRLGALKCAGRRWHEGTAGNGLQILGLQQQVKFLTSANQMQLLANACRKLDEPAKRMRPLTANIIDGRRSRQTNPAPTDRRGAQFVPLVESVHTRRRSRR
jgi:hypothetical protein